MQQRASGEETRAPAGPDVWARDALALLCTEPSVTRVGIALAEGGGRRLLFTASDRDNEPGMDWCQIDAYADVPLNTAVRNGDLVAGSLEQLAGRYADFVARQDPEATRALAAVPIAAAGQTLGGFVLYYAAAQGFDEYQRHDLCATGEDLGARLRQRQRTRVRPRPALAEQPVPDGAHVATYDVPADPAAVRAARRFLDTTLSDWGVAEDVAGTAVLCLSELVTNALIHTSAGCEVRVVLDEGVLTTTVRDSGTSVMQPAEAEDEDPLQVHGRGLQVVDVLASRWGSDLDEVGTTVWFVLDT